MSYSTDDLPPESQGFSGSSEPLPYPGVIVDFDGDGDFTIEWSHTFDGRMDDLRITQWKLSPKPPLSWWQRLLRLFSLAPRWTHFRCTKRDFPIDPATDGMQDH